MNQEFRILTDAARNEYLRRLGEAVERVDWRLLSYAIMSNHVHLGLEAGDAPVQLLMQSLQGGYALWMNRRQGRDGPFWSQRYKQFMGETCAFGMHMVTYQHNNPVRAGVAQTAWDSTWTSHQAYVGLAPRPPWLDVARGLEICGYTDTPHGRRQFDALTLGRQHIGRDEWLDPQWVFEIRTRTRQMTGWPVEAHAPEIIPAADTVKDAIPAGAQPERGPDRFSASIPLAVPPEHAQAVHWGYDVYEVLEVASELFCVELQCLRGETRGTWITPVRRAVAWAWVRKLGGPLADVCRALNRTRSAYSRALDRIDRNPHCYERMLGDALAEEMLAQRKLEPTG